MNSQNPTVLGLKKSFGFGDRLGLAGPGHIAANEKFDFAGIFAQQSIRELDRTRRTAEEVMSAAQKSLAAVENDKPWGADADHLKTAEDVRRMANAGYTFFTIDPSDYVVNEANQMSQNELQETVSRQESAGIYDGESLESLYLEKNYEISNEFDLCFTRERLMRAGVKYGEAVNHMEKMAKHISRECAGRLYEIEVSVDETETPTTTLEHLFIALELKRRGVAVISLAPRFVGDFEKGVDFKGSLQLFEETLKEHIAIAKKMGPYKLSLHSGSDKFSIYPIFGRVCGELLHVKTAGTSYLEALRVILREDLPLFKEITCYSAGRFPVDKATYHLSVTDEDVLQLGHEKIENLEDFYLNQNKGRQILHVTFGSVLTDGKRENGQAFKEAILENLDRHSNLHKEVLEAHFSKHLELLGKG